jgi:hypothetical protein
LYFLANGSQELMKKLDDCVLGSVHRNIFGKTGLRRVSLLVVSLVQPLVANARASAAKRKRKLFFGENAKPN